ncbi:MAG: hypothetical protein GXC73_02560 [Chitinophagaceae bacterium]|nr:hypothetical protein [Chitinophagaceae bacterium]
MKTLSLQQSITPVQTLLKYCFGIVPIVAGFDKFTNLLTNWEQYLNPSIGNLLPFSPTVFLMLVGVIEILAGITVLIKTELGAYIVAAWLTLIGLTLLLSLSYLDVAVRDLVLAASAFSLARLTKFTTATQDQYGIS